MNRIFITESKAKSDILAPAALKLFDGTSEPLKYDDNGKPFFSGTGISISHSGKYWVCAFSEKRCGIDIEKIRNIDYEKLAERFFCDCEKSMIKDRKTFFEVWTAKEAYAKFTGEGLIKTMRISPFESDVSIDMIDCDDDYVISVCTEEKTDFCISYFEVD